MKARKRWAFFLSLKIGVQFTLADGTEFVKTSETHGKRVSDNSLVPFAENRIVFFVG
jgi:hypothetical protein